MSKKYPKLKIAELLELFGKSPEEAFRKCISSGIYFRHSKSPAFWSDYSSLDVDDLCVIFPNSISVFTDMDWLKYFHDLDEIYAKEKLAKVNEIVALNPTEKDLITAMGSLLQIRMSFTYAAKYA